MWDHLDIHPAVANLLTWQRHAALRKLEREMTEDNAAGYCVDEALERYMEIKHQMRGNIE